MTDIVNVDFKMKGEEIFPTYMTIGAIVNNYEKMKKEGEVGGKSFNDLGIKGLVRFLNELELYLEV